MAIFFVNRAAQNAQNAQFASLMLDQVSAKRAPDSHGSDEPTIYWLTPVIQPRDEMIGAMARRPPVVVGRAIRQTNSEPIMMEQRGRCLPPASAGGLKTAVGALQPVPVASGHSGEQSDLLGSSHREVTTASSRIGRRLRGNRQTAGTPEAWRATRAPPGSWTRAIRSSCADAAPASS